MPYFSSACRVVRLRLYEVRLTDSGHTADKHYSVQRMLKFVNLKVKVFWKYVYQGEISQKTFIITVL